MEALTIASFKYGVDTRRTDLTSQPGTLVQCENGHITPGGTIEKRFAFVPLIDSSVLVDTNKDQGAFGFQETDSGPAVFGSAVPFGTTTAFGQPNITVATPVSNPQVVYQQLQHPEMVDMANADQVGITYERTVHRMTAVAYSVSFQGKAFVAATFADGRTYLYFNGSLIQSSRNGIVLTNETSLNALGRDLARQVATIEGWLATKNGDVFTGTAVFGMAFPAVTAAVTPSLGVGATISTTASKGIITSATVVAAGSGYVVGDFVFVQDSSGSGAIVKVLTLNGSGIATVSVVYGGLGNYDGVDLIMSPQVVTFSPNFPPNTSMPNGLVSGAGLTGTKEIDQADPGIPAVAATAAFSLSSLTGSGTITIAAPKQNNAQNPTVNLTPTPVPWNTSATQTATDVVTAINKNTLFTGYSASNLDASNNLSATVTITAPTSFGGFVLSIVVNTTGDLVATGTPGVSHFALTLTPPNVDAESLGTTTSANVTGSTTASVSGNKGSPTFAWTAVQNDQGIVFNASGSTCTFSKTVIVDTTASGTFKCTATDNGGTEPPVSVLFTVSLSYNKTSGGNGPPNPP